jgi:cardiolipin synthase (CMP-forming)
MGAHISNPSPNPAARPASIVPAAVGHVRLRQLLKVPNIISLCRIGMVPIFLVLLSKDRFTGALYVFALAALTDALDGAVARWFDIRTELGAILDPFADKLMLLSALVVLTFEHALPVWLLILTAIRDIVLVLGYLMISFAAGERFPVRPSVFGKMTTVLLIVCVIGTLMSHFGLSQGEWYAMLYLTGAVLVVSGIHYLYQALVYLSQHVPELFS